MHDISAADGFVEITEDIADMIKFVANEPSVGLFYIQQHSQNATPNLINLKNNVVEKSHEASLHTEDLEDSMIMLRSMKECGVPIADEMIRDIKKSLSIVSTKQPKIGLIYNSSTGFLGRTSSWSPATWGQNSLYTQQEDSEKSRGYFSSIFKSAKQTANNLKLPLVEGSQSSEKLLFDLNPTVPSTSNSSLTVPEAGNEDLPVSSDIERELKEESQLSKSLSHQHFLSLSEKYDEFKADREAKLEEWLGGMGNEDRGALAR